MELTISNMTNAAASHFLQWLFNRYANDLRVYA